VEHPWYTTTLVLAVVQWQHAWHESHEVPVRIRLAHGHLGDGADKGKGRKPHHFPTLARRSGSGDPSYGSLRGSTPRLGSKEFGRSPTRRSDQCGASGCVADRAPGVQLPSRVMSGSQVREIKTATYTDKNAGQ
jgi:hypothetical protein